MLAVAGSFLRAVATWNPSNPGIFTSKRIRSGRSPRASFSASSPSRAVMTAAGKPSRTSAIARTTYGSSSATRTRHSVIAATYARRTRPVPASSRRTRLCRKVLEVDEALERREARLDLGYGQCAQSIQREGLDVEGCQYRSHDHGLPKTGGVEAH